MTVAKVIVDVPAKQTDRPFDYLIPEELEEVIQPGMRVIVPFGPRKVQGFVESLEETSSFKSLKKIIEPMDLVPVLNKELLSLADWLSHSTLCYKISAFQAMLPPALKAKYERKVKRVMGKEQDMAEGVAALFRNMEEVVWEEALKNVSLSALQKEVKKGTIEVSYEVQSRGQKKKVKHIYPLVKREDLTDYEESLNKNAKKQKELLAFFSEHPEPIEQKQLLTKLKISTAAIKGLVEKGLLGEIDKEVYRDPYQEREFERTYALPLTDDQAKVVAPIHQAVKEERHEVFLLYGVTGSGKTEVYLQSIEKVLAKGEEAIVLVPEIALTPQMVNRFKGRFGELVAVLHSGLSVGEKYDEWRKIQRNEVKVVVGARSAIFAPFTNLGIIIIDEEHEMTYKQEENPRYHAKDVAIERGKKHGCSIILGSATPSLESFARAQKGVYTLLSLPNRMNNQSLPNVEIIDMREELRTGNRSMFSEVLLDKLKDRLEKKEQTVLFLNKRGHSSFVMCRDCGYVVKCPNCDISLTYHRFQNQMKCHYCGYETYTPTTCPECSSEHIRYFGTGTQKVEEELAKILPEARVIRMDVDTTSRKGAHEKLLQKFQDGEADILLGTQMIAKGLDFPRITLVGVLSADTMLHLPDFRSSEKTFQLLTQVSGRAGRHELKGEVIFQTYTPEHYSIELASEQDYDRFYETEMMIRRQHAYPPYYFLTMITISHEELMKVVGVSEKITQIVRNRLSPQTVILGPVASPIARIKNKYRYQCLIKYKQEPNLEEVLKSILDHYQTEISTNGLQISIDVNPFILM
ncbi:MULTISPECIES: primosomal protein N' [unclassified Bacillus (in: firmicutes)]|uniref:primosomal protein N' n=1 Tax=unclassified Bacillus (in: firmicutes) TaxID=185979 RepID=UPI0004E0F1B8|nr:MULTISPECIES: primosomal protein N' [unclassified Bacillus (in: firmicutes)]